jgi:hypothetical protein
MSLCKFLNPEAVEEAIAEVARVAKAEGVDVALIGGVAMKVFWHQGRWMISSSRGWETLTEESSIITREICMERPQHWYAPDLPA